MEQIKWNVPEDGGLLVSPPSDFTPEKDKNATWFAKQTRWIVGTFYNQPSQPFNNSAGLTQGLASSCIQNWSYVFGEQHNYRYKYATTNTDGVALPVTWQPGAKIGSLVDHMKGILLGAIENIEVTATNLSKNVASERAALKEKLLIQYEIKEVVGQMLPKGVKFAPINDPDAQLNSKEEIEKYVESYQDKYSIIAEKMGTAQIFQDDLKEKFLQDGTNQIVSGISGILTEVENGQVVNTVIPDYELIWDNRNNDPWNGKAYACGYVKHNEPYQEIIRKYGQFMEKDDVEEIRRMAQGGYSNMLEFVSYYNNNFGVGNAFNWWTSWGTSNMTIATATVYFIAPRDWRYRKGNNRLGVERIQKINDNETYDVEGTKYKGAEINGDYDGWDIHQATIIGNKYICNYGYMPNTIRHLNKKGRPLLPINIFCSGMVLNQGKSVVRKLIPLQDELDLYAFKIKEKVANDMGRNYVFNGNKFDGITSTEILNDLKAMHVFVSTGSSGEADDPQNAQRMVEAVDMTLDDNIIRYVELRRTLESEMEMIASVSKIALGQQGAVIGKTVQAETINQNSTGTASLNWGMMKHFNKVLQYNVNLKQMLYQFKDTVEEALIIGDAGSELIRILDPKEFGTQVLQVFLDIASTLDPLQRQELRTIALSEAQNGRLDTLDYIEHILMAPTLNQAVKGLKYAKNKQIRELKEQNEQAAQGQMQHEADLQLQKDSSAAAIIQLKEDNANYREELKAFSKQMQSIQDFIMNQPPPPPSPLQAVNAQSQVAPPMTV